MWSFRRARKDRCLRGLYHGVCIQSELTHLEQGLLPSSQYLDSENREPCALGLCVLVLFIVVFIVVFFHPTWVEFQQLTIVFLQIFVKLWILFG